MARAHWRFVVRDDQGFVIQNAQVFVYQPDTTTVFTGTAYTAASGGSTTTNPFTTNAQGEVEAWFDTTQVIDVLVTDNTNQAYRAATAATADFSSFAEKDDIYYAGSEIQSTNPHGATDHTNVTRYQFVEAQRFVLGTGGTPPTFVTRGSEPEAYRVVRYADAATGAAYCQFMIQDWASGVVTAQPYWIPGSTDGTPHTVRWSYTAKSMVAGVSGDAAGTTTPWTGSSAARTTPNLVIDTATSTVITPASATDPFRLTIQRIGADGADTYVGTVDLVGVLISYTAVQ